MCAKRRKREIVELSQFFVAVGADACIRPRVDASIDPYNFARGSNDPYNC